MTTGSRSGRRRSSTSAGSAANSALSFGRYFLIVIPVPFGTVFVPRVDQHVRANGINRAYPGFGNNNVRYRTYLKIYVLDARYSNPHSHTVVYAQAPVVVRGSRRQHIRHRRSGRISGPGNTKRVFTQASLVPPFPRSHPGH